MPVFGAGKYLVRLNSTSLEYSSDGGESWTAATAPEPDAATAQAAADAAQADATQALADAATAQAAADAAQADATTALNRVVVAGSHAAEETTASLTPVDLVTISGLNIPVGATVRITGLMRKTAGAATIFGLGLKVNDTVVGEADINSTSRVAYLSNVDRAEFGAFEIMIPPRSAAYPRTSYGLNANYYATGGDHVLLTRPGQDADMPTAAITSIAIRAVSGDAAVTGAVSNVVVYTLPTG